MERHERPSSCQLHEARVRLRHPGAELRESAHVHAHGVAPGAKEGRARSKSSQDMRGGDQLWTAART